MMMPRTPATRSSNSINQLFGLLILAHAGLWISSGALQRPIGGNTLEGYAITVVVHQTNVGMLVVGAALYTLTLFVCLSRLKSIYIVAPLQILFVLNGLAILSAFWSFDPLLTLNRAFGLTGCTILAVVLSSLLGVPRMLRALTVFSISFILLNAAIAVLFPSYAFHSSTDFFRIQGGLLRGTYVHKNYFAPVLSLALICVFVFGRQVIGNRILYLLVIACGLVLLGLTGSAKTFISVPVALGGGLVLSGMRRPRTRIFTLCTSVAGLFALYLVGILDPLWQTVLSAVGRDATLSDRTLIWRVAVDSGMKHPMLGGGYGGAAWKGGIGSALQAAIGSDPTHAHNGFLQAFVELGFVGLGFAILYLCDLWRRTLTLGPHRRRREYWFLVSWLLLFMLNNLAGSYLMQTSDIYWFMLVFSAYLTEWIHAERFTCERSGEAYKGGGISAPTMGA